MPVWDGIVKPDFRVLAVSAAPSRSNLVIGLLDPSKKCDFHGRWTQLGRRCWFRAHSVDCRWEV